MYRQKIKENGFAALDIVVIVVVLAVISAAAAYLWQRRHTVTAKTTPAAGTAVQTPTAASQQPNSYAGWQTYTSVLEKLSFKYPSTWTPLGGGGSTSHVYSSPSYRSELFSVDSPTENLPGKTIFIAVQFAADTRGESSGSCQGLPIYATKSITISGRQLTVVTLESATAPHDLISMSLTSESGLKPGGSTATCEPFFTSRHGNGGVLLTASFVLPPKPGDKNDGTSTTITPDQYSQSSLVPLVYKLFESVAY